MLVLTLLGLECFDSLGSVHVYMNVVEHPGFYSQKEKLYLYHPYLRQDTWGIYAIDVTDPTNPFPAGTVKVFEYARGDLYDAFSIDSFLYFLGDEGGYFRLFVFALEPDPTHPKLVRTVPSKVKLPAKSPPKSFGHDNPWEYVPEEGLLYYIENYYDYVFVYDVSDPSNPQFLGYSNFATGPNDWHAMLIRYPYLYIARTFEVDTYAFSTHLEVYKISNKVNFTLIGSTNELEGTTDYKGLGFLVSKDSSRKFVLVPGGYTFPNAVEVTDPTNPTWTEVDDPDRVLVKAQYFTSTPDDRRVYLTNFSRIAVVEADPTPRVVCVDTLMPPEGTSMEADGITWFRGLLYANVVNWLNKDFVEYYLILQYPEDNVPEYSEPSLARFRVPTFQRNMLKVISPKEGWFDLKLFAPTGALVAKRRVYLKKGVNLVDISSLRPSGVYFLQVGKETKPFKLVFLAERR